MKIGLLTHHRVINIGSILQAYCVKEFYKSLGHEVILIDLRNWKTEFYEYRKLFNLKKLKINFFHYNKLKNSRSFLKKNFKFTKPIFSGNIKKFNELLINNKFDLISVGSDTVWELRKNGYTKHSVNEFFLPNYPKKKISISASMDPIDENFLNLKKIKDVLDKRMKSLKDFNFINVRDFQTLNIIKRYELDANITSDPTILMIRSAIFKTFKGNKKNLMGLQLDSVSTKNIFDKYKDKKNTIDLNGYINNKIQKQFISNLSIEEYLKFLQNLNLLITNRFRGTLLTLLVSNCSIPIIGYEDPQKWKSGKSKLREIFLELNLKDFITNDIEKVIYIKKKIDEKSLIWPNESIKKKLNILSNKSKELLKKQLECLN